MGSEGLRVPATPTSSVDSPEGGTAPERPAVSSRAWVEVDRLIAAGYTTFHLSYGAPRYEWYCSFFGDVKAPGAIGRGATREAAILDAAGKVPTPVPSHGDSEGSGRALPGEGVS